MLFGWNLSGFINYIFKRNAHQHLLYLNVNVFKNTHTGETIFLRYKSRHDRPKGAGERAAGGRLREQPAASTAVSYHKPRRCERTEKSKTKKKSPKNPRTTRTQIQRYIRPKNKLEPKAKNEAIRCERNEYEFQIHGSWNVFFYILFEIGAEASAATNSLLK